MWKCISLSGTTLSAFRFLGVFMIFVIIAIALGRGVELTYQHQVVRQKALGYPEPGKRRSLLAISV